MSASYINYGIFGIIPVEEFEMNTIKSDDPEKLEMALAQRDALMKVLREIAEPIQARSADNLRARAVKALRSVAGRNTRS
jgi:hypothetical protein